MFIEQLSQDIVQTKFFRPFQKINSYDIQEDKSRIRIEYTNIVTNAKGEVYFYDFESTAFDHRLYVNVMYNIFEEEYKSAYLNYVDNLFS